jgi:hypothetical protein
MCFNNGSKDWQYFARDILCDRRFLIRAVGVGPHAGVVVLEDAVVGPHDGEVSPEDAAMDEDAGKAKGTALPADTTDMSVSRANSCSGSIAASESAISEGRFQTNLLWTSLGCQWAAIILMVLLRYLPFHYGGKKGTETNLNSNLGYRHTNRTTPLLAPPPVTLR